MLRLKQGDSLHWSTRDNPGIALIYGEGGGCHIDVADDAAGIWIPLRGALRLTTRYSTHALHTGEVVVTTYPVTVQARTHLDSRWLVTLGSHQTWARLLAGTSAAYRQFLPEQCEANRTLRRQAITLVRAASAIERNVALRAMADLISELQMPLEEVITRCPGRTYAQKRQVFVRLQRVRTFMATCCERELDNDLLSRMASYSTHHFLYTFKLVYRETPHTYLVKQRLQKAQRLLHESHLAITEVALASGFGNLSAFSRLFHQNFGITAKEAKRRLKIGSDS
ncbi:MAG TPA: AraC family transcriptional regulator [Rhodanobacteraceae bacterium]|nr:AraC family transcriptional regulator [Rhodanobacteraceae bacterium]